MDISIFKTHDEIDNHSNRINVAIKLSTPSISLRTSLDDILLILLLDISSSMNGAKLEALKASVMYVLERCGKNCHISIITFNSKVTNMTNGIISLDDKFPHRAEQLQKIINDIRDLKAEGPTNIGGALDQGFKMFCKFKDISDVMSSMLLLTDGQNNYEFSDSSIKSSVVEKFTKEGLQIPIYTFAIGEEPNAKLLALISTYSTGIYYFIANETEIASRLGECIGGLINCAHSSVSIGIDCNSGCRLIRVINKTTCLKIDNKKFNVFIGNLQFGESKTILVELSLRKMKETELVKGIQKLFQTTISFDRSKSLTSPPVEIKRCDNPQVKPIPAEIELAQLQAETLSDIESIIREADNDCYSNASKLVGEAKSKYSGIVSDNPIITEALEKTIDDLSSIGQMVSDNDSYKKHKNRTTSYVSIYESEYLKSDAQIEEAENAKKISGRYMTM